MRYDAWSRRLHRHYTNLNAQRYHDDILTSRVIPLLHNNTNIQIFERDNTTSHTDKDTVQLLGLNNMDIIDEWLAKNPGLNPIEHISDNLARLVSVAPPTHKPQ